MSILLITHDLGVVAENADVVAVMYASKIVEYAPGDGIVRSSEASVYTEGLFRAVPRLGDDGRRLQAIFGDGAESGEIPQRMQVSSAAVRECRG